MAFVIADRVKETSITTGSGSLTLAGAYGGYQAFSAAIGNANKTFYAIENETRWEVGIGTYTSAGNTLSRDTILDSSAGGAKINMDGVSIVFCTYPADHAVFFNDQKYIDARSQSGILLPHSEFTSSGTSLLHVTVSGAMVSLPNLDTIVPLTVIKGSSGCFFHQYVDDLYDHTIALHTDGVSSSTWKLGFKTSPNNPYDPPTFGYVYGKDGQAGLWGNTQNHVDITNTTGFTVTHSNRNMLTVNSTTGVYSVGSGRFDAIIFPDGSIQRTAALSGVTNATLDDTQETIHYPTFVSVSGSIVAVEISTGLQYIPNSGGAGYGALKVLQYGTGDHVVITPFSIESSFGPTRFNFEEAYYAYLGVPILTWNNQEIGGMTLINIPHGLVVGEGSGPTSGIHSIGKVGIGAGMSAPTQQLSVSGNLMVTQIPSGTNETDIVLVTSSGVLVKRNNLFNYRRHFMFMGG